MPLSKGAAANVSRVPRQLRDVATCGDSIGIDVVFEPDFLWIALELLAEDLPEGWDKHWDANNGAYYYHSSATGEITWDSPAQGKYQKVYEDANAKAGGKQLSMSSRKEARKRVLASRGEPLSCWTDETKGLAA